MVFITDKKCLSDLDSYLIVLTKGAHYYNSKEIILKRLLNTCANTLNIDINWHHSFNTVFIHPHNSFKIENIWKNINKEFKVSFDEINNYKIIKYSDYVPLLDVQKFITFIANKNKNLLLNVLAMDGFQGNLKNYIPHLSVGDEGSCHIVIVRDIYTKFRGCSVKTVLLALLKIFINFAKDDEIRQLVQNTIQEIECDIPLENTNFASDIKNITDLYTKKVENLELIAKVKMAQLKIKKKKMLRLLRIQNPKLIDKAKPSKTH